MQPEDAITVVTTTCPIPTCPSTCIIDVAYASLRKQLPRAKMLLLMDGFIPKENQRRYFPRLIESEEYAAYKQTLKTRVQTGEWTNVQIMEFEKWHQQAGMVQYTLQNGLVKTPLMMFQEHDYYFLDRHIEWDKIVQTLLNKDLSLVRFSNDPLDRWLREGWRHYGGSLRFNGMEFLEARHFYSVLCIGRTDFFEWLITAFDAYRGLWGHTEAKGNYLECFTTQSFYENNRSMHKIGLYAPEGAGGDNQRIGTNDGSQTE